MDSPGTNTNGTSSGAWKYEFDGFELDPPNRTLLKNGETVHLRGKAFDVLVQLVEKPGTLLSKEELVEKVWAASFVEEGSVARTVSNLRKALGDEGKEHRLIATVQGHGYRFIGDVKKGTNGSAPPVELSAPHPVAVRQRPVVLWTLVAVVVTIGAGLALSQLGLSFKDTTGHSWLDTVRPVKITQTGDVYAPRISSDGQYLAFISATKYIRNLSVRHNASGSVLTPVTDADGIWALDVAPDNTFVYYIQKNSATETGDLFRVPLLGGVPFKVAESASGGLTIAPDGSQAAFTRNDRENGRCSIVVVNADGTNERTIHSITFEDMYHALDWAPDAKSFAVSIKIAQLDGSFRWYVAEVDAASGMEVTIGNEPEMLVTGLEWLPDKSGLIANAIDRQTKQAQIYHISYPEGRFRRVTNDLDHYQGVSLTADGRKIVTMRESISRQIWSSFDGNSSRLTAGGQQHIDSVGWIGEFALAFSEDVNGTRNNYNIWRMRADGSAKQQLTFGGDNNVELAVSPDERYIAFVSRRSGRDQIWRIDGDGAHLIQLSNVDHNVTMPMFSADSKKVYFLGWVNTGLRLFEVPVDGGEAKIALNDDIYYSWAPSPDGKYIAYLTFDREVKHRRIHVFSLETKRTAHVVDIAAETWLGWSADSQALYFTSHLDGVSNVWQAPSNGGKAEQVTDFADERIFRFAVSPRSGRLAVVRESITYDAIMLMPDPR